MRTSSREENLVRRAKAGDKQAFGQLVRIYQHDILFLIYDFMRDIAQDVFIKAFSGISSFEQRSSFETWLKRIAVNSAIDALRKKKRMPETEQLKNEPEDTNDSIRSDDIRDLVETTFHNLSPNQRTAVVLRYFQGETIDEIADIMNVTENTVRIHIHRAMEKIRRILRK
jgi:RNA polymerase sigma-70 factor (ECF subfamily)